MTTATEQRDRLAHDPHRPRYHFLPPANWMNDPNGLIQWRGQYHMFYQHNPVAARFGPIHWGHAVSDDLVHWRDLPIALSPTPGAPDADGCWSGCIVDDNGVPTMIYTGMRDPKQRPCLATSADDLLTWTKYAGNPLIAAPPPEMDQIDFRDHSVWNEDGIWYQVIGSSVPSVGGAALLYRSRDLRDWEYLHPLCTGDKRETGTMWECPDFFPLGEKHILVLSPIPLRKSIYLVGTYAEHRFTPARIGEVDVGGHFYAPQTLRDDHGRRIMFGWLWEGRSAQAHEAAGWAGVMSLPRVLTLGSDGRVGFEPAPELTTLRGAHHRWDGVRLAAASEPTALEIQGDCLEIVAEMAPGDAAVCGIDVRRSPDGAERTRIVYDQARGRLEIDRQRSSSSAEDQHDVQGGDLVLPDGEPLRLRIFVDRSVVEVFANRGVCATSRVYPSRPDSLGVALFAEGGTAEGRSIESWEMNSIWTA
jgi:beta-fructofuranosidase